MRTLSARVSTLHLTLLIAAAYALTGRLGLALPYVGSNITLFWPPAGIAVAALWICGSRVWPGIALGAFIVNLWVGTPLWAALAIAAGNTLGPLATIALLHGTKFRGFERPQDVLVYSASVLAGMIVPPLLGVATLCLSGAIPWPDYAGAWLMWWLGDTVGALIVGSVLLTFTGAQARAIRSRPIEAGCLYGVAIVCAWTLFAFTHQPSVMDPPFAFLSLIPLVWAAFRFGAFGTSSVALLLSIATAWAAATGGGQFDVGDAREGLLLMWAYMATIGALGLTINALQADRRQAMAELAKSQTMLDAIRRAQSKLIVEMNAERTLDDLLAELAQVTGSAFVFVAETPRDREGRPDAANCAITHSAWRADVAEQQPLRGASVTTLLAALEGGVQAVKLSFDAKRSRISEWLPIAVPVTTLLALPLVHAGELIGVVGFADREGGYEDDAADALEPVVTTLASVVAFREAEARRRLESQRLSYALASGEMAMFDWNIQSGEVFLTEQWRSILGEFPEQTRTTLAELNALVHPDDQPGLRDALVALLKGERAYHAEHRVRTRDDRWVWIECNGQVIQRDERGRALRMIGTNKVITGRKLAEQALRASEEKFAKAFRASPALIAISTLDDGRFIDANEAYERVLGYRREELLGRTSLELGMWANPDDRERMLAAIDRDGRVRDFELSMRKKNGEAMICEFSSEPLVIDGVSCILSITQDVTQRKRDEAQMRLASKVFETTADAIVLTDPDDRVIMVNAAFTRMTGFGADEMLGKPLSESPFRPIDPEESAARMEQQRRHGFIATEVLRYRKDGTELPLWVTASNVVESGEVVNFVRVFTDISKLKSSQRQLEALASNDSLTGLLNRRVFDDRLDHAIRRTARTDEQIALLFIDLDGFKQINDTHGHDAGDLCLQRIAARLQACVRGGDTLCRLGGDEFAVILEGSHSEHDARRVAERVVAACERPLTINKRTLYLSASVGVAIQGRDGDDAKTLLKSADRAMYFAKQEGGSALRMHAAA